MSKIFELFGYPVDSWNEEAWENLKKATCPFMDAECDGGGNRFASSIKLAQHKNLKPFFKKGLKTVHAGVCSLQLHDGDNPWIVCPRRLLNFRGESGNTHQDCIKEKLFQYALLKTGQRYRVWSEIKMKCNVTNGNEKETLFDYTFDYIVSHFGPERLSVACDLLGKTEGQTRSLAAENGMTIARRDGVYWIEDFPKAPLIFVEIMTSSTSGGNDAKRTQVSQVFEDTILKLANQEASPNGPGINYRQVWARMVSQLLVKSQIGIVWGGTTIWVIQDLLADYISKTTALDLEDFLATTTNEVNIISSGYGESINCDKRKGATLIDFQDVKLFSGPVSGTQTTTKSFVDIVKLGCTPSVNDLWKRLLEKKSCATFIVP
jgi:hypothetical protein